jgi:hypothetical protein
MAQQAMGGMPSIDDSILPSAFNLNRTLGVGDAIEGSSQVPAALVLGLQ